MFHIDLTVEHSQVVADENEHFKLVILAKANTEAATCFSDREHKSQTIDSNRTLYIDYERTRRKRTNTFRIRRAFSYGQVRTEKKDCCNVTKRTEYTYLKQDFT